MADTLSPEEIERLAQRLERGLFTLEEEKRMIAALRDLADCKRMLAEARALQEEMAAQCGMTPDELMREYGPRLAAAKEKPNG